MMLTIKYRTCRNGELPIFRNDEKVQVYLFNKNGICDIISAETPEYFIPGYQITKETVEKWVNSQEHWNKLDYETVGIISTESDSLEAERFGAAIYYIKIKR